MAPLLCLARALPITRLADDCYGLLRQTKQSFAALPADLPDGPSALFGQSIADYEAETQRQEKAGLLAPNQRAARLRAAAALHAGAGELRPAQTADGQQACALLREQVQQLADQREPAQAAASAALDAAFDSSWQTSASRPRQPPAQRWTQPSTLWSRPLGRARSWGCSSPR